MPIRLRQVFLPVVAASCCLLLGAPMLPRAHNGLRPAKGMDAAGSGFAIQANVRDEAVRIYLAGYNRLSCLDAKTWKVLWSMKTPYGSIDAGPVVSRDTLLYSGGGGGFTIYGADAETGRMLWSQRHTSLWLAVGPHALFADGLASGVTAVAPQTGKRLWDFGGIGPGSIGKIFYYEGKIYTAGYILDSRDGKLVQRLPSSPRAFAAVGDKVFLANFNATLEARSAASARVLWSVKTPLGMNPVSISANRSLVFAVFYDGEPFLAHRGLLRAYAAADGHLVWERALVSHVQALGDDPIGADHENVYLIEPTETKHGSLLCALNAESGNLTWSYQTTMASGPPVPTRTALYLASGNESLLVLDKANGKLLRSVSFPDK